MDKRKAYEEKFEAQVNGWAAQLAGFKAKADQATAQAKIDYCEITEALQLKQEDAKTKLHHLKTASDAAWEEAKKGADTAWTDVKIAFRSATSKFN
jgi:hypothetical protein